MPLAVNVRYCSAKVSFSLQFRSTVITLEILRHYCSLNSKYLEDMDLMDQPGNAMSLIRHYHTNFDDFLWCLKPTKVREFFGLANVMI